MRAAYVDKLRRHMGRWYPRLFYDTDELARLVPILKQLPEGPDIMAKYRDALGLRLSDHEIPAEQREDLKALLKLTEKAVPLDR